MAVLLCSGFPSRFPLLRPVALQLPLLESITRLAIFRFLYIGNELITGARQCWQGRERSLQLKISA
jgi:hypothetical protein